VPNEQPKPPLDEAAFLDGLLELDRGLLAPDSATVSAPPRASNLPSRGQPGEWRGAEGHAASEPVVAGPMAARRRPRHALSAVPSASRGRFSSAPPLGDLAAGPDASPARGAPPPARSTQPLAPAQAYQTFYGFDEPPFGLSSDPKFLFRSASFERASGTISDAIERREPVIVLTGERGTGKTTLCLALAGQHGTAARATLLTHPPASFDALLNAIERSSLVIADDADRWPVEMLDQLQGLSEGAREQCPQVLLVGEPVLLDRLRHRTLRPLNRRVKTRGRLGPLASHDVGAYVAHRLAVAGTGVRVEFDADAIAGLYRMSGGVPRLINRLCDAALAGGHRVSASRIDRGLVTAAAEELNFARPVSRGRAILQAAMTMLAFVGLVLLGMGAAAWIFRAEVARVVFEWQTPATMPRIPDPPPAPTLVAPQRAEDPRQPPSVPQ
jgi:general secretion pathway protein A